MSNPVYLTADELVARWNNRVSAKTLANWRAAGEGPEFIRFGSRIAYPVPKVEAYEAQQIFGSTKAHKARRMAEKVSKQAPAAVSIRKPRRGRPRKSDLSQAPASRASVDKGAALSPPDLPGACPHCGVGAQYTAFDCVRDVGVDETDGRFADVSVLKCRSCGALWLRYHFEIEAFTASGRWFRGLIDEATAISICPAEAFGYLQGLASHAFGGSFFGHAGAVRVKPQL
ncbi:MAG: hypothetical protein JSR86_19870 [Proteobacteria bacterium]|nr:hypothetical protein [Pseudomonadota bacterium]